MKAGNPISLSILCCTLSKTSHEKLCQARVFHERKNTDPENQCMEDDEIPLKGANGQFPGAFVASFFGSVVLLQLTWVRNCPPSCGLIRFDILFGDES